MMRPNMREDHHEWMEIYHFTPSAFEKSELHDPFGSERISPSRIIISVRAWRLTIIC
ncbi:hypothetical protein ABEW34_28980 [Paenibacillus algorifonticola]|uniref:hypothetical protein n=1 Tax=Paenibacillus algorifonticola TaxID=684063 RepID=UPI003D29022D